MTKPEYSISKEIIEKIFRKYNLEKVRSIAPLRAGLINPAFLINNQYVLRIDKSDHLKDVPGHGTRFEREAFLYDLLPQKGIATPTCLGLDSSGEFIPEKYIIVSYIKGTSLSDGFRKYDAQTKQKLSFQMGEILRKINAVMPVELNTKNEIFGQTIGWKTKHEKEFAFYLDEAIKEKYFSQEVEKTIKETFESYQKISDLANQLRLVHADFSVSNMQVQGGNIVGIFDFEWSHIGDPLWDLQKFPIDFQLGNGFSRKKFLKGYDMEQFSQKECIRIKIYCFYQGMWEIWATKTQLFPFGDREIAEGNTLIQSAMIL